MTTGKEVLDTPMGNNDAGAKTVRGYLVALLKTVWAEGEGFDGKRPFGNSGWEYELEEAVTAAFPKAYSDVLLGLAFDELLNPTDDTVTTELLSEVFVGPRFVKIGETYINTDQVFSIHENSYGTITIQGTHNSVWIAGSVDEVAEKLGATRGTAPIVSN